MNSSFIGLNMFGYFSATPLSFRKIDEETADGTFLDA